MSSSASEPVSSGGLSSSQWLILLLLALVQFTNILDFVIMMPLAPQFHDEWNLTAREFGFLVSAYAYAACLSGLLASWFLDRIDRKTALLGIYLIFTVANLLCAEAQTYGFLLMSRAIAGLSGGILGGVIMSIVGDLIPYSHRGMATGIIMSSFAVASIVGIPLGLIVAEHYSWRYTFMALTGLSVVLLVLAWYTLPQLRGHLLTESRLSPWESTWHMLSDWGHVRAYVLMACLVITTFSIIPYLPSYMVANVGVDKKDIKWIYLIGGAGTLISMTIIGKLADRYGKLVVFQILALLTIIPLLIVTHLPVVPLYLVLTVTTIMMVLTAGRSVPVMAMVTACTTSDRRGGFMSILASVQQLAMGLATTISGLILGVQVLPEQPAMAVQATHHAAPMAPLAGFPIVGWLASAMSLVTIYLATRLKRVDEVPVSAVADEPTEAHLTAELT